MPKKRKDSSNNQNMGGIAGKELMQVALAGIPAIIQAFQSTKSQKKNKEDDRIAEVLEMLQRDRNDINRIIKNQAQQEQIYQALVTLMNRQQELVLQGPRNDADNHRPRIRIEMDLPDDVGERDRAVHNFWITLGRVASAYEREQRLEGAGLCRVRDVERCENLALGSAPPFSDDEDECGKEATRLSSFLCCEICTQAYNSDERRPTLLPNCGHTFCKECLVKTRRRNRACPTCRKDCDVEVEHLPTNFSILEFMNEEMENKNKTKGISFESVDCKRKCIADNDPTFKDCDMSYDEQLEVAALISLEEYQQTQSHRDFLMAQRLQEEENRLMRFRQHEDDFRKSQIDDISIDDRQRRSSYNSSRVNSDRCSEEFSEDEEETTRAARKRHPHDHNNKEQTFNDEDIEISYLSSQNGVYTEARERLHEGNNIDYEDDELVLDHRFEDRYGSTDFEDVQDRKSARERCPSTHDNGEDEDLKGTDNGFHVNNSNCHNISQNTSLYESAQLKLKECEAEDDDEDLCKDAAVGTESVWEESWYETEKKAMLARAAKTHAEDRDRRMTAKMLREQEELETALLISLSMMPEHQ